MEKITNQKSLIKKYKIQINHWFTNKKKKKKSLFLIFTHIHPIIFSNKDHFDLYPHKNLDYVIFCF